jgi:hypothetical protein
MMMVMEWSCDATHARTFGITKEKRRFMPYARIAKSSFVFQKRRKEVIEMADEFLMGMLVGVAVMALFLIVMVTPYLNTVRELCDQKYGAANWTGSVEDGYMVCDAKKTIDIQCRVDGIGLKRCEGD